MSISTDTRFESYQKVDKNRMYGLILSTLKEHEQNGLTARELAVILYNQGHIKSNERQATAPRLTELVDAGSIMVIGKRQDAISLKNVAVYSIAGSSASERNTAHEPNFE